jgi:hypothetical protein
MRVRVSIRYAKLRVNWCCNKRLTGRAIHETLLSPLAGSTLMRASLALTTHSMCVNYCKERLNMARKALNTGNEAEESEVVFEDASNPEAEVTADMVTPEGEPSGETNEQIDARVEADLDAAGINIDAADAKRTTARQRRNLMKKIGDIGEAYGAGKTSMIELAQEVTEAAVNRTIGESDAEDLYKTFRARADKRATTDAGVVPDEEAVIGSLDQQVSKVRSFIKLGNSMDEGLDIVSRAIAVHLAAKDANPKAVMKGSTYTVIGSIVTEQLRPTYGGAAMTNEQMHAHIARDVIEKGPPTAADKVRAALDSAIAAQKGSSSDKHPRAPLVSQHLEDAIDALYRALGDASPAAQQAFDQELADAKAKADAAEEKKAKKKAA